LSSETVETLQQLASRAARRDISPRRPVSLGWTRLLSHTPTSRFMTARAAYSYGGLASTEDELARLIVQGARHRWRYSTRAMTLCSNRRRAALMRRIETFGMEHLTRALATGRGIVLTSVHLSDFDLGGAWISHVSGREVVAVVGGPCPHLREAAFNRMRRTCAVLVRREEDTRIADLAGDLARGRIVSLMLDRHPQAGGVEVKFFGRRAVLSAAPLILARRTGAPVIVAGLKAQEAGGHLVRIAPTSAVTASSGGVAWLQGIALQLEGLIRWAPDQWHMPPHISQLPWGTPLVPDDVP
jgi:phosphatidylinositol dimannoside acyltransferase